MVLRAARALILSATFFVAAGFFFLPPRLHAQDITQTTEAVGESAGLGSADLVATIGTIISVFLGALGVIFLILVIYAGFLWMTAAGDAKKVEKKWEAKRC